MATEYTVTYAFNGYLRGEYREAISRISETVAQLQREGIDIEFRGATQEINGAGQLIAVTARYEAPSKEAVGDSTPARVSRPPGHHRAMGKTHLSRRGATVPSQAASEYESAEIAFG